MFYLQRYLNAQNSGGIYDNMSTYEEALQEIHNGHKRTHWMWYVFPQMKGLGHSQLSDFYGIDGREEAYAYLEHPILRQRLVEATEATMNHNVYSLFGDDTVKFRACMLLFASVSDIPIFKEVIAKYCWK
jgi:uncharacterized protein (DUF1810 family)